MLVIPAPRRLKKDHEFEASLSTQQDGISKNKNK
jgi:hypothetical protein